MKIARGEMKDDLVERTLAALGKVETPEGLEARVLAGVERKVVEVRTVRVAVTGVWWRGAVSGAAVAIVCVGLVLLVQERMRVRADGPRLGQRVLVTETQPEKAVVRASSSTVGVIAERPCPSLAGQDGRGAARAPRPEMMRVESVVPARRVTEPGLTVEERELVRLARVSDLTQLASLDPEVRARQEAQEAAEYQKFFAKPAVKVEVGPGSEDGAPASVEPISKPEIEPVAGGVQ